MHHDSDPQANIKSLNKEISRFPDVDYSGLTLDSDKNWGIQVWLKPAPTSNLQKVKADILQYCSPYPVYFEISDNNPMSARPAYPEKEQTDFTVL